VTTAPDVVIVGGGVVGAGCARELARAGHRVRLLERGQESGEAWRASAGLLSPQIDAHVSDPLFELGIAGREYWREQAPGLRESTGVDVDLWEGGILEVAVGERDVNRLKEMVAWQRQHGHRCEWLDAEEVRREWPWLGVVAGGLHAPHDGSVDPVRAVEALRADAARLGVELVTETVTGLTRTSGRVTGVQGRERHAAGRVVVAAGAWSGRLGNLPRPLSVEPVRGQIAAYPWPAGAQPGIVLGHGAYLLHRRGEALAGSTLEHAGFDASVTEEGLASIHERAEQLVPSLAHARRTRAWAGLRPGTPDGLPIIGREPNLEGLWYATGHGRHGVLLAGITGVIITHLMAGEATFEEVSALKPERFWSW
jgi:glycine oxidase